MCFASPDDAAVGSWQQQQEKQQHPHPHQQQQQQRVCLVLIWSCSNGGTFKLFSLSVKAAIFLLSRSFAYVWVLWEFSFWASRDETMVQLGALPSFATFPTTVFSPSHPPRLLRKMPTLRCHPPCEGIVVGTPWSTWLCHQPTAWLPPSHSRTQPPILVLMLSLALLFWRLGLSWLALLCLRPLSFVLPPVFGVLLHPVFFSSPSSLDSPCSRSSC